MHKGTTIEELISSVCRAEEHAREIQRLEESMPAVWQQHPQYQELVEVA